LNIIAQVFGFIALAFMALSYQETNKKELLKKQIFANVFYALQYLSLNAVSAVSMNILSIIRAVVFGKNESKNNKIILLIIFEATIITIGFITYTDLTSLIPILIALLYTYGLWQSNLKIICIIGIISASLWIYYNLLVGAYVSIFGSFVELFSSILGLYKILKRK
jgi:hypothetical protein